MDGNALTRGATWIATRLAAAVVLAAALLASQSAPTPALAASHHHLSRGHSTCHHAHLRRCAHRPSHHKHHDVGTSAQAQPASNASAPCANANLIPTSDNIPQIDAATLCLVNQQRARRHLHALRNNAKLDSAALHHAQNMIAANYYDHTSPTGETPVGWMTASGYLRPQDGYEIGENIDLGAYTSATPAAIVADWMNSPDHRANILNPDYLDSGIGVVAEIPAQYSGGGTAATYVQEFGVVQAPNGALS